MSHKHSPENQQEWKLTRPAAFAALDPANIPEPIAVLVFHGMGQQAQFETLNDVILAFIQSHTEKGWNVKLRTDHWLDLPLDGTVDLTKLNRNPQSDKLLPLAQVTMEKDGKQQDFDFFEAYWAPLTEGVVGFWDSISFLLRAALAGVFASLAGKGFKRFTFGISKTYPIGYLAGFQLLLAGLVVASLLITAFAFLGSLGLELLKFLDIPLLALAAP